MARKKSTDRVEATDYRHSGEKRTNNPPARIAGEGKVPKVERVRYAYSPHLPPVLRFDPTGRADQISGEIESILRKAEKGPLSGDEVMQVREAVAHYQPWLEWAGKREQHEKGWFEVDPVALHIHERVSAQAIVRTAMREDVQRDLFADPQQTYQQAVQFYRHSVDWANRIILGDSLQVMSSLARRENLAGKVQMIYMDPPYGIKFASNFQSEVGRRDVKDKDADLTREAEMVKAYRDTWVQGVHSYLGYLRDRLLVARDLLAPSGSLFVQISDENLHRVRSLLDGVFGPENFCGLIVYQKTGGFSPTLIARNADFILWYARDLTSAKYKQLYEERELTSDELVFYDSVRFASGEGRLLASTTEEIATLLKRQDARVFARNPLTSDGWIDSLSRPYVFSGRTFSPTANSHWKTTPDGLERLERAERLTVKGNVLRVVRYMDDMPVKARTSLWTDTGTGG
ncbi:MAG TPA: DNA methyltransferase, partial [Thermoanaerobaculia bacterium]|nr:DNA methyltransferase [Thermoanaerobaculia bacterium]